MSFGLFRPKTCRAVALVVPMALGLTCLSGCGDSYSDAIQYTVRTDPLFTKAPGEEQLDPDRPGQFPLYSITDLQDSRNPLHPLADRLVKDDTIRDPGKLSAEDRQKLDDILGKFFGTPAEPRAHGISKEAREALKLDADTLERGSRFYRLHCLQCHGVTGDGRGPTAKWVNPHPRDYRQGLFKFQSVDQAETADRKPRREDLARVIREGVEGTAMPAHNLLPQHEVNDLVSYVIHLSIRGQAEFDTLKNAFDGNMKLNKDTAPRGPVAYLKEAARRIGTNWLKSQADAALIKPVAYPTFTPEALEKSVRRGQKIFLGEDQEIKASCVSCHKDYGRESLFRYDAWGTLVRPTNLTAGVYRGGRRPVDLYWRIHSGINGSGMAPFGNTLPGNQVWIWDMVNFLQALPYPAMRAKYEIQLD